MGSGQVADQVQQAEDGGAIGLFDVVHASILRFFPDLVTSLGGDPEELLRRADIDPLCLTEDRPGTTYREIVNLIDFAATDLQCPDFGMRLAKVQGGGNMFGPLGHAMRNSRTFGDALEYASRHIYAHSLAARVWLRWSPSGKSVFSGHDILLDRIPNKSQAMEQLLLLGHLAALELTGGHARVRRVHFRHQPISPPHVYRRYFGCDVYFGQDDDGVVFYEQDLACPVVDQDTQAFAAVAAYIDRHFSRQHLPIHAEARGIIMQRLQTGQCTNESVAAELNIHPRTLHRRLKAEGSSFQQIKDEVRRDILLYYLEQTDLDFTRISEKLGFAEQSVMTRSCKRWFSASPTSLRARRRD